jgi:trimeric autotransporter adhesin
MADWRVTPDAASCTLVTDAVVQAGDPFTALHAWCRAATTAASAAADSTTATATATAAAGVTVASCNAALRALGECAAQARNGQLEELAHATAAAVTETVERLKRHSVAAASTATSTASTTAAAAIAATTAGDSDSSTSSGSAALWQTAQRLAAELLPAAALKPDRGTYTALVAVAAAAAASQAAALTALAAMRTAGFTPDARAYAPVLRSAAAAGDAPAVLSLLDSMTAEQVALPDTLYGALVSALAAGGHIDGAEAVFERFQAAPAPAAAAIKPAAAAVAAADATTGTTTAVAAAAAQPCPAWCALVRAYISSHDVARAVHAVAAAAAAGAAVDRSCHVLALLALVRVGNTAGALSAVRTAAAAGVQFDSAELEPLVSLGVAVIALLYL